VTRTSGSLLTLSGHIHHPIAQSWFDKLEAEDVVVMGRSIQLTFLRLLTTSAVYYPQSDQPLTNGAAWQAYDAAIDDSRIRLEEDEPPGLERWWRQYSQRNTASPKLWMDAYLAAFARAGDYRLVTIDAAFKQFAGLDLLLLG
jgi:toxin-antitoxin system PIN domain toxin